MKTCASCLFCERFDFRGKAVCTWVRALSKGPLPHWLGDGLSEVRPGVTINCPAWVSAISGVGQGREFSSSPLT